MKYEVINARSMLVKDTYEVIIKQTPENWLEYLKPTNEQKYHVRQNEWYKMPGFQRCPEDLEKRLSILYTSIQRLSEQPPPQTSAP